MTAPVNVAIVARNMIVREGLDNILGTTPFLVVAKAPDAAALLAQLTDRPPPHLVLLDATTSEDAIAQCRLLRHQLHSAQLVMMADDCRVDAIARAFNAGIGGYLARGIAGEALACALRLVALGEHVIPTATVTALVDTRFAPSRPSAATGEPLSEREAAILRRVARGDPNKQISDALGITQTTVKGHIKAIMRKLGVRNRTQAAIWAIMNDPGPENCAQPAGSVAVD